MKDSKNKAKSEKPKTEVKKGEKVKLDQFTPTKNISRPKSSKEVKPRIPSQGDPKFAVKKPRPGKRVFDERPYKDYDELLS